MRCFLSTLVQFFFCVIDVYCDGTDFETVKRRCEAQPLKKQHMTAHRVPVSSSILVENHSPSTDAEDLHNYFQTPRANAGAVLEVKPIENADKFKVVFASTKGKQNHRHNYRHYYHHRFHHENQENKDDGHGNFVNNKNNSTMIYVHDLFYFKY